MTFSTTTKKLSLSIACLLLIAPSGYGCSKSSIPKQAAEPVQVDVAPKQHRPHQKDVELLERFDEDKNGWLDRDERIRAREHLQSLAKAQPLQPSNTDKGPPNRTHSATASPPEPGRRLSPADVSSFADKGLYDSDVLRTVFINFPNDDWEEELTVFKKSDVKVPATVTVDGQKYEGVGVHFKGMSSFMMVDAGQKRSLALTLNMVDKTQRLLGYRRVTLLNSHDDPSFLRSVLALHISRTYMPAPEANLMHVVINGESWGIYVNQQHFNKDFLAEKFQTKKGTRWKVPGSPHGRGGLEYLGDKVDDYRDIYAIKSKENPEAWQRLIELCRVLSQTPPTELEQALESLVNVDEVLRFLALENVLANGDGYWTRASDYSLYLDPDGRFHMIPYDVNETFSAGHGGPAGPRPPKAPQGAPENSKPPHAHEGRTRGRGPSGGIDLAPLTAAQDDSKPMLSKLLAVPALRQRYLSYVRSMADEWLNWDRLNPIATNYHNLIAEEVAQDTRKLYSTAAFKNSVVGRDSEPKEAQGRQVIGLKSFAEQRREFLIQFTSAPDESGR